jgi:hypothetical protein
LNRNQKGEVQSRNSMETSQKSDRLIGAFAYAKEHLWRHKRTRKPKNPLKHKSVSWGPVHDLPGPTSTSIFRFPQRMRQNTSSRRKSIRIDNGGCRLFITKLETRVSFSITVLLYVSRSQPCQKTLEFHLSMTTRSKRGSGIEWIADAFQKTASQENRYQDRWLTDQKWSELVQSHYFVKGTCDEDALEIKESAEKTKFNRPNLIRSIGKCGITANMRCLLSHVRTLTSTFHVGLNDYLQGH